MLGWFYRLNNYLVISVGEVLPILEINNAHVCKDKVCFKTSFVLVKNISDKVILGLISQLIGIKTLRLTP